MADSEYFGDTTDIAHDALARSAHRASVGPNLRTTSYLRPMTPYGESYTPSYTSFLNSPSNSYTNPMHTLFNDRRPTASKIRTTLFPKEGV